MELSVIQTNLISLVGTIASLAVGLGLLGEPVEQVIVSAAGTLISLAFALFSELRVKSKVQAAVAVGDKTTLTKLARR